MSMRVQLSRRDQLRRTTPEQLPSYSAAVLAQFEEIEAATNAWADENHNSDGSHSVIRLGNPSSQLTLTWDGTNLTWTKPDGTTGNLV